MTDRISMTVPSTTIGIDVSDRKSHVCVLNAAGDVVRETIIPTTPKGLTDLLTACPGARVAYEVGCHSPWMSRCVEASGCESIVAG